MTAIFAVWNNYGFSLAADSNQTAQKDNQTWVDPVEKILMLEKHQIAFGAAGSTFHQGVEVNEIFRSWEKSLDNQEFDSFNEYFLNFAKWFAIQNFSASKIDIANFEHLAKTWLSEILKLTRKFESDFLEEDLENMLISQEKTGFDAVNFLGPDWELLSNFEEDEQGNTSEIDSLIIDLRVKLLQERPSIADNNFLFTDEDKLDSDLFTKFTDVYLDIFEREFDAENQIDLKILELCICMISNLSQTTRDIEIIMIGFGNHDWLPSAVSFKIYPAFFGLPRLFISAWSNPNINWYMSIAVDAAVEELTRGMSMERSREIVEFAGNYISDSDVQLFAQQLNHKSNEKFHKTLSRLEYLTIDRLEFVSRLFVQIEALKSFLDEPVPGVGGDTKVISMTKTTRRQKYFKEFE